MEYGKKETKPEHVKKAFSVKWLGDFGAEVDEFDRLDDARLYAGLVDGIIPELLENPAKAMA
jgi:hypothetical protein